MATPFDSYPYTNFHELNLAYFITHFREIFAQWAELYDTMVSWKDATTAELDAWREEVEGEIADWETNLMAALDEWKGQTEDDISDWETATLEALDAWKTAFETLFETTFSNLSDIKTAAEAARDAAQAAQAAAEAAAASVSSSAAQIATNKTDIATLKRDAIAQWQTINQLHSLVDYDYDTPYYQEGDPSGERWFNKIDLSRNGSIVHLTKPDAVTFNTRIRLSGSIAFAGNQRAVQGWTEGFTLDPTHEYRAVSTLLFGTSTFDTETHRVPPVQVLKTGETSSVGTGEYSDDYRTFTRTFTPEAGQEYNITLYMVENQYVITDAVISVTLEDVTANTLINTLDSIEEEISDLGEILEDVEPLVDWHLAEIPTNYKRIEFAESNGNQRINLGFKMNQDTRMVCRFMLTAELPLTANGSMFGGRTSTSSRAYAFAYSSNSQFWVNYNTGSYPLGKELDHSIHTIDINGRYFYFDGELCNSAPEAEFETTVNASMFAIRGTGNYYYGKTRIYEFWVYNTVGLIHHYLPCIRVSDNVVGMYDTVEDVFMAPVSDTLIAGNILSISDAYEQIETLESLVDINKRDSVTKEAFEEFAEELRNSTTLVPEYVQTEADTVSARVRKVQTGTSITFCIISDLHYATIDDTYENVSKDVVHAALYDMRDAVVAISRQTHIDYYACLGDIIYRLSSHNRGDYDVGLAETIGATKLINECFGIAPQIRLVGNHDPNAEGLTGYFTADEMNAYTGLYSNICKDPSIPYGAFGYLDIPDKKVRVIALNTSFYGTALTPVQHSTQYTFTAAQGEWLSEALDLSDKNDAAYWNIVLLSHVALDNPSRPTHYYMITDILDKYLTGGSWSLTDTDPNTGTPDQSYGYDFSGKNAAKLSLYINGHAHRYNLDNTHVTNSQGDTTKILSIPRAEIINALPARDATSLDGVLYTKTAGTAESTAFQIATVDFANNILYLHHYGAGIDIILHLDVTTVSGSETFSTSLTSPTWFTKNDTIETVNAGVVTAVSAGYNIIFAKSSDDNMIEAWCTLASVE